MNLEKLLNKKIDRKTFLKSIGFILLALIFFPRDALSFLNEEQKNKKDEKNKEGIYINNIKAMEIIDE